MRPSRALALTAVAVLLAGCNHGAKSAAPPNVPDVVSTTTAAAAPVPTLTRGPASAKPTPVRTAAASPTAHATTARPKPAPTTARPTPRPTPKPTPKPVITTPPPATGTFPLSISGHAFHPQSISIPRGTTVKATNQDTQIHDWTSDAGVWGSGSLAPGQSYSYRFMTTGQFNFSCTIHPDMTGRVTVT